VAGVAFVLVGASAHARTHGSSFQVVGGTWVAEASATLLGPAWLIDGPTSSFGATVRGPGGFSRHIGGPLQRYPGMPATRSINWCDSCNVLDAGGDVRTVSQPTAWTASADDGTPGSFTIDRASRLTPVVLSRTGFDSSPRSVTASWTAGADAKSFIVYVQRQDATSSTDWLAGTVLPADARSFSFGGLDLDPKVGYSLDIFGFSADIAGTTPPEVFNVASSRLDFLPGQPLPAPRIGHGCCPIDRVHPYPYPASRGITVSTRWISLGPYRFAAKPTYTTLRARLGPASDCVAFPGSSGWALATWSRVGVSAWLRAHGGRSACVAPDAAEVKAIRLSGSTWRTRRGIRVGASLTTLQRQYPHAAAVRSVSGRHGSGFLLTHAKPTLYAETDLQRVTALVVVP
jgi:hypothetical protein